jgi:hypothetical protein
VTTVSEAALARGWTVKYDDDPGNAEFPFAWFTPDGDLHDCYRSINDLPLADIASVEDKQKP